MKADHRRLRGAAFSALLALGAASPAQAGLCGDSSGDGYVRSTDALATLRLSVAGGYDRRADVKPSGGDGKILASDSLETLRAAVDDARVLKCAGSAATRAVVSTAPIAFDGAGGIAVVDVATRSFQFRGGAIWVDSVIRTPDRTPVVVNRQFGNSLQFLDLSKPALPSIKECSVSDGFNSNPQDVLIVSEHKGYVTPYGGGKLLVIDPAVLFDPLTDPACETLITGRIDLSAYDSDGIPQMDQMAVVGSDLFVTLQLLDNSTDLQPKQNGLVVVIDTATDTVKGTIPLSFANPFGESKGIAYDEFQKLLFVGGPGNTGILGANLDDGGLEAIDPVTQKSAGLLLSGSDLHANLVDFVIVGTRRAFAIVFDASSNSLVEIDLKDRSVKKTLLSSADAMITDLEMTDSGELWVAYRGESKNDPDGIRIFRASDGSELTTAPLDLGQAPFTLAFLP